MELIKTLFDKNKDINRTIEKVITYTSAEEQSLKAEISEYEVTESIEEQLEKLLSRMQLAMAEGGPNEVGVWVSGFYGSGKSSFTKYLGLAFDEHKQIDGIPFLQHLQNRVHRKQTKALLATVAKRFPAAVVMLDLAADMLAGATMEEISTVLYYKVLQWAGYSQNLKVAAFERKLKKDGRFEEFKQLILDSAKLEWSTVQNDPLVVDSLIPEIAHQIYPDIFKTASSFTTETTDIVQFENQRVTEMLDIIREATGKEYVLFVIDEVGQYVAPRPNLILNLDGLAKNLKEIGNGKVWIIGTAQQTLTEDDQRAAINSRELYKLKDRFPIQIDLEASDIKEICYRRLLGKSADGEQQLGEIFVKGGQALRHNTKLKDARYYDSDLSKESFIKFYPFLPAHFEILLHLLGALAKSTGGYGLRSAIKVVQDILIERSGKRVPLGEQTTGTLVTMVTIYDSLEKDIGRASVGVYGSVGKVLACYPESVIHQEVAKTVAIMQILDNLPITVHNVAALIQPNIEAPSRREVVEKSVNDLMADPNVPFGEQEGSLCFFSEKLNDIEKERTQIPLRSIETRRIFNEALKEIFTPLPSARLDGSLAVKTGLKSRRGSYTLSLDGRRETIQMVVELVTAEDYETAKTGLVEESRPPVSKYVIFLLARNISDTEEKLAEIYRCREICHRYRNEPDQEVKDYCKSQADRSGKLVQDLQRLLRQNLLKGSFIFRGQTTAINSLNPDLLEAGKQYLGTVAAQVYERYSEAPVRAETTLAEKFLKLENLMAATTKTDPLNLIKTISGKPAINIEHKALISIRDAIDRHGKLEGKRLIEYFSGPPFGWSQDTLRYLIAALLLGGKVALTVSGKEITVNGQQAIEALKTNINFKPIGVSFRGEGPGIEEMARAAERLEELIGEKVMPVEDQICKTAVKYLPRIQSQIAPLGEKLVSLGLPGSERINTALDDIAELLFADASDAPKRFGNQESALYEDLKWAGEVRNTFNHGLEATIRDIQNYRSEISFFSDPDIPAELSAELTDELERLGEYLKKEAFFTHATDLSTGLTHLQAKIADASLLLTKAQQQIIEDNKQRLQQLPEWKELTREEQSNTSADLETTSIKADPDLQGLKQQIQQKGRIYDKVRDVSNRIIEIGKKRRVENENQRRKKAEEENTLLKTIAVPSRIKSLEKLNAVIHKLETLRADALKHDSFEINFIIDDGAE